VSFGIKVNSSYASLGNVSIQPQAPTGTGFVTIQNSPTPQSANSVASKISPSSAFSAIAASIKTGLQFTRFNFGIVKEFPFLWRDVRFNDSLPVPTAKFTPYEELSNISSTRPEIITISEFKPLYADNNTSVTPSGDFLDAQVKLMNLRQQAIISLIKDLKKDQQIAEQLDQQEGNFLLHVKNLKTRVTFLQNVQDSIDRTSKLFDIRDFSLRVDVKALLSQYYRQVFNDINTAAVEYPLYGYTDLLADHGFSKSRILKFSGTKIYLQILNEAKKMLRAGTDELLGIDPSLIANDADPVGLNRRTYKDPHVDLGKTQFPTLSDLVQSKIHVSDTHLTTALNTLNDGFLGLDNAFSGATSEEIAYTKKIRVITREYVYSKALFDLTTIDLLKQYGYTISETIGNQQLFDAVYGQIGNRITDDRSNNNQNTLSSISSKIVNNSSILTFEADYLQNDDGSTFTPGASYYINSVVRPSDNGFSLQNPTELTVRMNGVIDRYVDFLGKFNILPKNSNRLTSQDTATLIASDSVVMLNALYQLYVEPSTGLLKSDVADSAMVSFLGVAATDSRLRANLLMYMYCASNMTGEGLPDVESAREQAGQSLRSEDFSAIAVAENQYTKVSATLDKIIKNCLIRYQTLTGDDVFTKEIEASLRNFNEKALISRIISFIIQFSSALSKGSTATTTKGFTRYSVTTDFCLIALALQLVLDSARRYAYVKSEQNLALNINANYAQANITTTSKIQTTLRQLVTPKVSNQVASAIGSSPLASSFSNAAIGFAKFISKSSLKQSVETRLIREDELTVKTAIAPLNLVKTCRDSLEQFVLFLQKSDSVTTLNDIMRIIGDRKLVELLGERGQVQILTDVMEDVLSRVDPTSTANASNTDIVDVTSLSRGVGDSDDLKMFDDSFITSASANIIKAALSDNSFNVQRGSNIRLMSVGLPHGFSAKLRNNFKISAFAEQVASKPKQNDVVILDIYKIDVRYPDLVFKPISKVFELSRFAVRNENQFSNIKVGANLNSTLDAIPTKDYSNIANPRITTGPEQVINDSTYDFMSPDDCRNMVRNHVMSYILELYFRIMTGIPVSERELFISDPDDKDIPAPFITKAILTHAAEKVFQVPVNSDLKMDLGKFINKYFTETSQIVNNSTSIKASGGTSFLQQMNKQQLVIDQLPVKKYSEIVGYAGAASDLGKKHTVYSDVDQTAKRLLSPKLFERIFWLAIDPDDYEIDYEETMVSSVGQSTFSKLQQAGEIETQTEKLGLFSRDIYKIRDLKTSQQELVFEKYFITVREYSRLPFKTLLGGGILNLDSKKFGK
jgi:hypothetical protein